MNNDVKQIYEDGKDSIKSVVEMVSARLKNPLLSAFFIAFILYNWKAFLFIIFSKSTIEKKISHIQEYHNCYYLIVPIIIAVCYFILLPFFLFGFEKIISYPYNWRLGLNYRNKILETRKKGVLAVAEKKTQNIVSGNRDKNNLLIQIKNLENTISELNDAQRNKEELHNTQLKNLNADLQLANSRNSISDLKSTAEYNPKLVAFAIKFDSVEANNLVKTYLEHKYIPYKELLSDKMEEMLNLRLITNNIEEGYSVTERGKQFINYLDKLFGSNIL